LVVATGHAMMGVSLGPITGEMVGQILAGEPTGIDLQLASVDRFRD
jgi:D-amino-acid dehydrogenase